MDDVTVSCSTCQVDLTGQSPGMPCPKCGARVRTYHKTLGGFADGHGGLHVKVRDRLTRKIVARVKVVTEVFKLDNVLTDVMRVVNRRENEYHERITRHDTGEVRREVHEPLDRHRGHGDASKKKPKRQA